jgi:membrane associated rhomboid family serine protease
MSTRNFWLMVLAFAIVEFVGTILTVQTGFTWWPVVAAALIGVASGFLLKRQRGNPHE